MNEDLSPNFICAQPNTAGFLVFLLGAQQDLDYLAATVDWRLFEL